MDNVIFLNFGKVPCGQKVVENIKIENKTRNTQVLEVKEQTEKSEFVINGVLNSRFSIHPTQAVLHPKHTASFKVEYYSYAADVTDNFIFNICDSDSLVRRLNVRAISVGPSLSPTTFNIKFFRFRDVNQTTKHIEITNSARQEVKFYIDIDDDYKPIQISQTCGVIPGGLKLGLKLTFNPSEPGVYHKKIFCIVQFHNPLIFNILAVYKPKAKVEPKSLKFRYPVEVECSNSYEAYMYRESLDKLPDGDKIQYSLKCLEDLDLSDITSLTGSNHERSYCKQTSQPNFKPDIKQHEVFLTKKYIDVKNSPEVLAATTLLNFSKCQHYYYEWDHDPKDNFQISPCKGFIKPNTKTDFAVYFTPPNSDNLYHIEFDIRVYPYEEEPKIDSISTIDLPLTMSLKIIGHSFPDESGGWVPQCKITPKVLYMSPCSPNEKIYATFIIEREGHLPVNFTVLPTTYPNFHVRPPLGYLSRKFQLFVVEFSAKEHGFYSDELSIKFNNSDKNIETIRLMVTVEEPRLVFGKDNIIRFEPVFPGSTVSTTVQIRNPTDLCLSYEFQIDPDLTWVEIVNPKGVMEPNTTGKLHVIFKPKILWEYMDYINCKVSSIKKSDCNGTIRLQVLGSCQFGYLVATPSVHDFGTCIYKKEQTIQIHLFNFSFILLYFRLNVVCISIPEGSADTDVTIIPNKGKVSAKSSFQIQVKLKPHNIGEYEYAIECQNYKDDSYNSEPCEIARKIISLKFLGVLPCIQISDVNIYNGGSLFSPDMIWKMLCVDNVNEALSSVKSRHIIKCKLPEAIRNSSSAIVFLMETFYDKLTWNVTLELQCPCYEASSRNVTEECLHTTAVYVRPTKHVTKVSEKAILMIKVNYDFTNDSVIVLTINLPYKKQMKLKMALISLPIEPATCLSTYLSLNHKLNPVSIGNPQPPLQLFWLYNNTEYSASYSVDMEVLRTYEQKIFDFINPQGTIPAFTSHPLGIIFSPIEMIQYSVDVPLDLGKATRQILHLVGEGMLQLEPVKLVGIKKTLPKYCSSEINDGDLECCENFVNIPYIGMDTKVSRIFFLRNTSKTEKWSFKWSRYKFENVFSVRVQPEKGIVEPDEKFPVTLFFQTFCYPTAISYSLHCETFNYSRMDAYKDAFRLQEILMEQDDQQFIITEKGEATTMTKIKIPQKPSPCNIFITVNANILNNAAMDEILAKNQRGTWREEKEIYDNLSLEVPLTPPMLHSVQTILEKLLWNILSNQSISEKIKHSQNSQDFIYKQIVEQKWKKRDELRALPSKCLLQNVLQSTIHELVCKNYIPRMKNEN